MPLTINELNDLVHISNTFAQVTHYLLNNGQVIDPHNHEPDLVQWYAHLINFKDILGNHNNYISFVSGLFAKAFLYNRFPHNIVEFEIHLSAQNNRGFDIETTLANHDRIIGEIKTTFPGHNGNFGGQQQTNIDNDISKLRNGHAAHKYFFVTDFGSFTRLSANQYNEKLGGITLVLLPQAINQVNPNPYVIVRPLQ